MRKWSFKLLKDDWSPSATDLPPVINPPGLSAERQWYLYDNIREYCPPHCQDVVCPLPQVPKPGSVPSSPTWDPPAEATPLSPPPQASATTLAPPPAKRQRVCSVCGEVGHNTGRHC